MTCNNYSASSDHRFLNQQEHRNIGRLLERAIKKLSSSKVNLQLSSVNDDSNEFNESGRRGVRFGQEDICDDSQNLESDLAGKFPSEAIQKKLAKGKSFARRKSPLQKFDEIVTRELTNRRMAEDGGMPSFEGSKKWSSVQCTGSKFSADFGRGKISVDDKVSRNTLNTVEKEIKDDDLSEVENAVLMDAIEKLAQAQTFCRFDAAVKAAEAATASVPPEKAEEVAVAWAKDYQSEIVDVINEKIPASEEKKPIEVIGYIGVTKMKES